MTMNILKYSGKGYLGFSPFIFIVYFQKGGLPFANILSLSLLFIIYIATFLAVFIHEKGKFSFAYNNYLAINSIVAILPF